MKKVALYCRVSTLEQTNENQKLKLLQYAAQNNQPFDLFEEKESTRKSRPVKQELMQRLRNGDYSALVVFKLDRFARSFSELIINVEEILNKKISFISISDNLDFSTAGGRLHFQILSAFCEFERALISERTRAGLQRFVADGGTLGRPKGSQDKRKRNKAGYYLREVRKKSSPFKNSTSSE